MSEPRLYPVEDARRGRRRGRAVGDAQRLGVHGTLDRVDWPAIRARVFGRIDPLHGSAVEHRRKGGIDVYTEPARFVAPRGELGQERRGVESASRRTFDVVVVIVIVIDRDRPVDPLCNRQGTVNGSPLRGDLDPAAVV